MLQPAGLRQEALLRVFGVEPHFDRVAVDRKLVLASGQRFAGGDAKLPFHQVLAGDVFGHRMLDLETGVHLHEEEEPSSSSRNSTVPAPT